MIQVADQPGNNRLVLLARAPTTDKLILVLVALIGNTSSLRMHRSDVVNQRIQPGQAEEQEGKLKPTGPQAPV